MKLIVYTDGASRGNPGPASYGFVIFDENNHKIKEKGQYIGINTNNFAEYSAVLKALEYIRKKFLNQSLSIKFLIDSKLVVEQLSGRFKIKSPNLRPFVQKIRKLEAKFKEVSYQHVPRSMNILADAQANLALDSLK